MSDLNHLIASWRQSMADFSDRQLDELEDHLREQVAVLQEHGLSVSEAFAVASMRCGRPAELADEFAQADPAAAWSRRLRWMIVGFVLCVLGNDLIMKANAMFGMALVKQGLPLSTTIMLRILFLTALMAVVVALWHGWWRRRQNLLTMRPPGWLTSGWTLAIALVGLPWLWASYRLLAPWLLTTQPGRFVGILIRQFVTASSEEVKELAISGAYTGMILPYTIPLMLLIIAISLSKRARRVA